LGHVANDVEDLGEFFEFDIELLLVCIYVQDVKRLGVFKALFLLFEHPWPFFGIL